MTTTVLEKSTTFSDLRGFLATYPGGITVEEGIALSDYAAQCPNGVIVEIGAFKGKSSVALAEGQTRGAFTDGGRVYCVEPHLPFTGLYGGKFGPQDRRDFYQVMLATGFFDRVSLVNLKSEVAAGGWREPIGLLFIDGDHTIEGVRADVAAWEAHVAVGGTIVFDDAIDPKAGPFHAVDALEKSGRFARHRAFGKMLALRKLVAAPVSVTPAQPSPVAAPALPASSAGKRILVVCHELAYSGGLLRFERFGQVIRRFGHHLAFAAFADNPRLFRDTSFPMLRLDEAARQSWDVTIAPGAGFPDPVIARFAEFHAPRYGVRMQHVLNDPTKRDGFLAVNRAFRPDIVVFNNRHWKPGDFTDFQAASFHFLEGAVDTEHLVPDPARYHRPASGRFVVGGLASKNVEPLIEAVRQCGAGVELHLFGQAGEIPAIHRRSVEEGWLRFSGMLNEQDLADYYGKLDCVAHTETFAGWANLAAEAMACGVPVICTPHGTGAFAEHEKTALLVAQPESEAIAASIQHLRGDRALAGRLAHAGRRRIEHFSWTGYSADLLRLMERPSAFYYTWAPDLGMFGKWPEAARLAGLEPLLAASAGKSVCDLGAGDGVIARRFLDRGAALVHGFEREASRVELAAALCTRSPATRFWEADLGDWTRFEAAHRDHLEPRYDIVLYLGLHHHLPPGNRMIFLDKAVSLSADWFAVRTPPALFAAENIQAFLEARGFDLVDAQAAGGARSLGSSHLFRRRAGA